MGVETIDRRPFAAGQCVIDYVPIRTPCAPWHTSILHAKFLLTTTCNADVFLATYARIDFYFNRTHVRFAFWR